MCIFDPTTRYRQERIKVLGYRTLEWDGSLNIPGFIYDDADVKDWESYTDYDIGTVVKNKEFYYSAPVKIPDTEIFDAKDWNISKNLKVDYLQTLNIKQPVCRFL